MMLAVFLSFLRSVNQLLTAGIAITAFALLLYALTFNLRDRVARSFAMILACVVIIFVCDAISSTVVSPADLEIWLRLQWVGIIFLPSTYLHFSDALLATTGRPSRGRRRLLIRVTYIASVLFLLAMPTGLLMGELVGLHPVDASYLKSTPLTWVFIGFYIVGMAWALTNCWRALRRSVTQTGKRRMTYLLAGAAAPSIGSFPYMIFGPQIATVFPLLFWLAVTLGNLVVAVLIVVMAYSVAFFGVSWPDRVVKRRLFKWLMRGPAAAIFVLGATTFVRRLGEQFGQSYSGVVPIVMVGSLLLFQYFVTLAAPVWERWLFYGGDRSDLHLIQTLEERLLTRGDLQQFLETILAAVCDRLQTTKAYIVTLESSGLEMLVSVGGSQKFDENETDGLLSTLSQNGSGRELLVLGNYWILPLFSQAEGQSQLLGFMGVERALADVIHEEQHEALVNLSEKAALALDDRVRQKQVVVSMESLAPQVDLIQRLRAASRYDSQEILASVEQASGQSDLVVWVKDALNHYWGGPKLTASPLIKLKVVQNALEAHEGNPVNALRATLRAAVEQVRPDGERRFTAEWILYNILEMKFLEGRKVRDVAMRLAMSEADLYRKQRVAIESVANAIVEMEEKLIQEENENEPRIY
jgi:hypothetical protein